MAANYGMKVSDHYLDILAHWIAHPSLSLYMLDNFEFFFFVVCRYFFSWIW